MMSPMTPEMAATIQQTHSFAPDKPNTAATEAPKRAKAWLVLAADGALAQRVIARVCQTSRTNVLELSDSGGRLCAGWQCDS